MYSLWLEHLVNGVILILNWNTNMQTPKVNNVFKILNQFPCLSWPNLVKGKVTKHLKPFSKNWISKAYLLTMTLTCPDWVLIWDHSLWQIFILEMQYMLLWMIGCQGKIQSIHSGGTGSKIVFVIHVIVVSFWNPVTYICGLATLLDMLVDK